MQTYQLDFLDGEFINPAYSFQISLSYILSDITTITGHTTVLLYFEHHFKKRNLLDRARIVYDLQKNEPEAMAALQCFFDHHKLIKNLKHPPKDIFLSYKKLENTIDKILKEWVDSLCISLEKNGYYAFSRNFKPGILNCSFWGEENSKPQPVDVSMYKTLSFQLSCEGMDKPIWLLSELFYSHLYFGEGGITTIDSIEEGKPYLIKCLKVPNISLLSCEELDMLKETIAKLTTSFRAETDVWAKQCYTTKNGIDFFKEKLMPLMATVQDAIDTDPLLKQWSNIDSMKNMTTIYFGEVSPEMLWNYYKDNHLLNEEVHKQLLAEYAAKENHTIPVMVFAYNLDELKLKVPPQENKIPQESVESVRKYMEI